MIFEKSDPNLEFLSYDITYTSILDFFSFSFLRGRYFWKSVKAARGWSISREAGLQTNTHQLQFQLLVSVSKKLAVPYRNGMPEITSVSNVNYLIPHRSRMTFDFNAIRVQ